MIAETNSSVHFFPPLLYSRQLQLTLVPAIPRTKNPKRSSRYFLDLCGQNCVHEGGNLEWREEEMKNTQSFLPSNGSTDYLSATIAAQHIMDKR